MSVLHSPILLAEFQGRTGLLSCGTFSEVVDTLSEILGTNNLQGLQMEILVNRDSYHQI